MLAFAISASAQNYDEALVPKYTLPEVLKTTAGKKITNSKDWEKIRALRHQNFRQSRLRLTCPYCNRHWVITCARGLMT